MTKVFLPCRLAGTNYAEFLKLTFTIYNIAFQPKADHRRLTTSSFDLCCCDLDLDPMTLKYELDLDAPKTYLHTKNEVFRSRLSKVKAWTDR